jgi:hypothetical protein
MQTLVKNAFVGLCFSVLILLVSSIPARAQVLGGSGDIAGYAGYFYTNNICEGSDDCPVSSNHGVYGANGGFSPSPWITVIGEYGYIPIYSGMGVTIHSQFYGGGARFNLNPKSRVVGYGVFTAGGDSIGGSGATDLTGEASVNGYTISFGGGASCFIGKHWGVRPEFRYVRSEFSAGGQSNSFNNFAMFGGVFYQFGGHGMKH